MKAETTVAESSGVEMTSKGERDKNLKRVNVLIGASKEYEQPCLS